MRIGLDAHTLGKRKTGNETYVRGLLGALPEAASGRHEVHFYHDGDPDIDLRAWRAQPHRIWPRQPAIRIPISFPWVLRRDRIDVAHFQYVTPPVAPCRMVVAIHDISFEYYPQFFHPGERQRMRLQVPFSARRAEHVITLSEFSKSTLVDRYRLDPGKVTVTPLAAEPAFRRISREQAMAAARGLLGEAPFVLAVGNLQPRKNLLRLVRAFARLRRRGDLEHDLVLVGQPAWQGSAVLDEVHRAGVQDFVRTTGYVDTERLVALYNLADVFVYPSIFEGFGLPVVEAMACGAPVVTSRASCLPEVAGDAALLVDPLSEDEIASALSRLAGDRAMRDRLRESAVAQAAQFTWTRTARETLAVYERVA